jgi:hypothetical protein
MGKLENINGEDLQPVVENIIKRVKGDEDPDILNAYRKAFKKTVPFSMRSWVTAYLFKEFSSKKGGRSITDGVSLFVSIGRNRKVYPKDLIHLFVNTGKVERNMIGDIKILDNYSFITINRKASEAAIDNLDGIDYRGRRLTVNFAKKKSAD